MERFSSLLSKLRTTAGLTTTGLADRLRSLDEQGVPLLDKTPRPGAEGKEIAFLHPKASGGVLLELCADPKEPHS